MNIFVKNIYLIVLSLTLLSISCTSGSKPSSKYQDTKEDLKKFMLEIKSAQDAKNFEKAERLILSIFPSKEISKKALRADLSPGLINDLYHIPLKINEMKKKMSKKEFTTFVSKRLLNLTAKAQEKVKLTIYETTTEELKAYKKGSIAEQEFGQRAKQAATKVLRPKMKFYKVVFSIEKKPGRTSLKSYSLIYWDASGWKTIDKIWKTRVWETL